jgi:hypothetical protein
MQSLTHTEIDRKRAIFVIRNSGRLPPAHLTCEHAIPERLAGNNLPSRSFAFPASPAGQRLPAEPRRPGGSLYPRRNPQDAPRRLCSPVQLAPRTRSPHGRAAALARHCRRMAAAGVEARRRLAICPGCLARAPRPLSCGPPINPRGNGRGLAVRRCRPSHRSWPSALETFDRLPYRLGCRGYCGHICTQSRGKLLSRVVSRAPCPRGLAQ